MLNLIFKQCCNKVDIKLYISRIKNLFNLGMVRSKICIKVFINVWIFILNVDLKISIGRNMNSRRWGFVFIIRAQEWIVVLFVDSSLNSIFRINSIIVQGSWIFSLWMICLIRVESECYVGKKLGILKVIFWFVYSIF